MKEDWDVKVLKETSEDNVLHKENYPSRGSRYFFGFDLKIVPSSRVSFSRRSLKKGNKRIFYYGK